VGEEVEWALSMDNAQPELQIFLVRIKDGDDDDDDDDDKWNDYFW